VAARGPVVTALKPNDPRLLERPLKCRDRIGPHAHLAAWQSVRRKETIRSAGADGRNVASIVKAGALKLGFDPATFGGHSLRAGFVTSAVKRGANLIKITDVTGHRSLEMLKTYSRDAEAFVGHAGEGLL
jgi:hypothetical protein